MMWLRKNKNGELLPASPDPLAEIVFYGALRIGTGANEIIALVVSST